MPMFDGMNSVYYELKSSILDMHDGLFVSGKIAQTWFLCGHSLAEQHYFIISIHSKIVIKSERYLREHSRGEDFAISSC